MQRLRPAHCTATPSGTQGSRCWHCSRAAAREVCRPGHRGTALHWTAARENVPVQGHDTWPHRHTQPALAAAQPWKCRAQEGLCPTGTQHNEFKAVSILTALLTCFTSTGSLKPLLLPSCWTPCGKPKEHRICLRNTGTRAVPH